jgi:hypothetical protein
MAVSGKKVFSQNFEFFTMAAKFGRPSFVLLATSNH